MAAPKRNSNESDQYPIRNALDRIGKRWSMSVLFALDENGTLRFSALKAMIEQISQRMLAHTLQGLERDGLLSRSVYPTNPPRVEYRLTPLGRSLLPPMRELVRWARHNQRRLLDARRRYETRPRQLVQ
jgi:DNA-binding HxlR family transcriptional regulator